MNLVANLATQARDKALLALASSDLSAGKSLISEAETILADALDAAKEGYRSAQDLGRFTLKAP